MLIIKKCFLFAFVFFTNLPGLRSPTFSMPCPWPRFVARHVPGQLAEGYPPANLTWKSTRWQEHIYAANRMMSSQFGQKSAMILTFSRTRINIYIYLYIMIYIYIDILNNHIDNVLSCPSTELVPHVLSALPWNPSSRSAPPPVVQQKQYLSTKMARKEFAICLLIFVIPKSLRSWGYELL